MKKRKVILITGQTGTGKSYKTNLLTKNEDRLIIIDDRWEYNNENGVIFYSFSDLSDYVIRYNPKFFVFICRFENDLDIEYLFRLCYELQNLTLVIEEAYNYIELRSRNTYFINHIIKRGRHKQISLILIVQRVPDININVRSEIQEIYCFRQSLPYDLDKLKPFGIEPEKVKTLKLGEFEYINFNADFVPEHLTEA